MLQLYAQGGRVRHVQKEVKASRVRPLSGWSMIAETHEACRLSGPDTLQGVHIVTIIMSA